MCQREVEGGKSCTEQCDHCKEYYSPIQKDKMENWKQDFKQWYYKQSDEAAPGMVDLDTLVFYVEHLLHKAEAKHKDSLNKIRELCLDYDLPEPVGTMIHSIAKSS